eukprot:CAMPEP_0119506564 /NCGR_PEP_ID=MMETSP1344-20130328/26744_1 /TAXON_ID=236787 /ORGANISM="Florenciella parvula, Strain CCMP2471" /LENGTH=103 /DNA_ID=CAMNT_0007543113 /DNA_START=42 /DNA_END=350 /DNA_ORIENTATION=+
MVHLILICVIARRNEHSYVWVRNNFNDHGEKEVGHASSPEECIAMVLESCPDADIANMPTSGKGDCWCQYAAHPDMRLDVDLPDHYMSCLLSGRDARREGGLW